MKLISSGLISGRLRDDVIPFPLNAPELYWNQPHIGTAALACGLRLLLLLLGSRPLEGGGSASISCILVLDDTFGYSVMLCRLLQLCPHMMELHVVGRLVWT